MSREHHPIFRLTVLGPLALLVPESPVSAEPIAGGALQIGESVGGESNWRLGASVYLLHPPTNGWHFGGELSGSIEAYTGGYGCGTLGNDVENVPALTVVCFQPGLAAHALFGYRAKAASKSSFIIQVGVGAATTFTVPGKGGDTQHETHPSLLARAGYLVGIGSALGSHWSVGIIAEQRAIGLSSTHYAPSVGIAMEGALR